MIEEAPCPAVSEEKRNAIGTLAADVVRKMGYRGAGTIEFLYEGGQFYFMEMNTRIQVEHPVTEMIIGLDLIAEQIRVAAGESLSLTKDNLRLRGHAIEVRINAEDPATFAPCPGRVTQFHPAGGLGVRFDSALYAGYRVPPHYDSMVGKLIVHGTTRTEALSRLRRALAETVIDGIKTTLPLAARIVDHPDFATGAYDIHWLERALEAGDL